MFCSKQMEPQLVPIAPDRKMDMRRILFARLRIEVRGEVRKALYFAMLMTDRMTVKKRAILGKA